MEKDGQKNITIDELAVMVAKGFSSIEGRFSSLEEKMVLKKDFELFKLDTSIHFSNIETDLRSIKNDISELKEKTDDTHDTVMSYDERIEKLENKVFA